MPHGAAAPGAGTVTVTLRAGPAGPAARSGDGSDSESLESRERNSGSESPPCPSKSSDRSSLRRQGRGLLRGHRPWSHPWSSPCVSDFGKLPSYGRSPPSRRDGKGYFCLATGRQRLLLPSTVRFSGSPPCPSKSSDRSSPSRSRPSARRRGDGASIWAAISFSTSGEVEAPNAVVTVKEVVAVQPVAG